MSARQLDVRTPTEFELLATRLTLRRTDHLTRVCIYGSPCAIAVRTTRWYPQAPSDGEIVFRFLRWLQLPGEWQPSTEHQSRQLGTPRTAVTRSSCCWRLRATPSCCLKSSCSPRALVTTTWSLVAFTYPVNCRPLLYTSSDTYIEWTWLTSRTTFYSRHYGTWTAGRQSINMSNCSTTTYNGFCTNTRRSSHELRISHYRLMPKP